MKWTWWEVEAGGYNLANGRDTEIVKGHMLLTSGYSDYVSDKALITGKIRGFVNMSIVHPSLQLKVWANIGMICFHSIENPSNTEKH